MKDLIPNEQVKLMRHLLASIDLSDIDKIDKERLDDEELMSRAIAAEVFFIQHFDKILKLFVNEQLKFIATEATDKEKLAFGRGTINAFAIINEWFDDQVRTARSRQSKKEEREKGGVNPL